MSAMATLSSSEDELSEDELSFGPRDVSLTAADFEESGTDSDFPAESSSGEKSASDDEAGKNPYLAAIASPGTRARRDSPNAARPPSPSPSPREDGVARRRRALETETKPFTSETAASPAPEPARFAPPPPTRHSRAVSDHTRGTTRESRVGNGHGLQGPGLVADIDIDIDRAETTAAETSSGDRSEKKDLRRDRDANADVSRVDEPMLERRVDALERALARLAATAETLLTEKKDVDARLERVEARAKELEARMKGADGDVPEHLNVVEIDRDSVAAIERAVEEATRSAMRSADARRVVESAVAAATSDAVAAARRELERELEASCERLVAERLERRLTTRTNDERADTLNLETRLETRIAARLETEAQNAALELERRLERRFETRLERASLVNTVENEKKTREFIRDETKRAAASIDLRSATDAATERVAKASASAETRMREAVRDALKSVAREKVKSAEDARSAAERVRRATKRAAAVEAIVAETEARARAAESSYEQLVASSRRAVDTIAAAEDAPRRVAAIETAVADVVDAVAEQLSAFKAEARGREAACAAHAARAAEAAEAAARGGPDARAARNASAADADKCATPAFVSSARAADSRARAEATARRLAASVGALRGDDVARLLARDGFGFDSPPTPSSRAAAALGSAETRSRGRTGALPFGALPFSLERRESEAASPAAVTAKSPRARKREWVA